MLTVLCYMPKLAVIWLRIPLDGLPCFRMTHGYLNPARLCVCCATASVGFCTRLRMTFSLILLDVLLFLISLCLVEYVGSGKSLNVWMQICCLHIQIVGLRLSGLNVFIKMHVTLGRTCGLAGLVINVNLGPYFYLMMA